MATDKGYLAARFVLIVSERRNTIRARFRQITRPLKLMNLSAALNLVVAHTSETDVARRRAALREKCNRMGFFLPEASESRGDPIPGLNKKSWDSWSTRETAVLKMESAITDGKIDIFARDPKSDALFHVDSQG